MTSYQCGPEQLQILTQGDMNHDHLERAEIASRVIANASTQIESDRELPDSVLLAMHEQRLFRLTLPNWLDGDELDPARLSQVTMRIASVDASAAWCLGQGLGCAMTSAYLERTVAHEIFGQHDAVLAWGAAPVGRATAVEGGYQVHGSWRFASGGKHAAWMGGHCKVFEANGKRRINQTGNPMERTVLVPRKAAAFSDDWQVIGLRGTRSEGYTIDNIFVDNAHTFGRDDAQECRSDSPLYVFPTHYVFASVFSGVALGIARGALDDLIELAMHKAEQGAPTTLRDSPVFQTSIAELEGRWRSAHAFQQSTLFEAWDGVCSVNQLNENNRARIRLATTFAINECAEVVQAAYRLAGSSAIFEGAPFERRFRDMHAVSQQVQARRANFEAVGKYLLGNDEHGL